MSFIYKFLSERRVYCIGRPIRQRYVQNGIVI